MNNRTDGSPILVSFPMHDQRNIIDRPDLIADPVATNPAQPGASGEWHINITIHVTDGDYDKLAQHVAQYIAQHLQARDLR